MSQATANEHASREKLMDYWLQRLPAPEMFELEEHFADCGGCAERANRVRQLAGFWDNWQERLETEEVSFVARVAAIVRGLAKGITADAGSLMGVFSFEAVGTRRINIRAISNLIKESPFLFAGPSLSEAMGSRPRGVVAIPTASRSSKGRPEVSITPAKKSGRMEVRLRNWPTRKSPPALILVSKKEDRPEQPLAWKRRQGDLVADALVDSGEYYLAFAEPERRAPKKREGSKNG